jgi:hypothetical protein
MGIVSPKSDGVQELSPARKIGVESAHGFGDGLFNAALIRELAYKHGTQIGVAVRPHCKDAFYNLPWVDEIVEIPHMNHGAAALRNLGYKEIIQITQNVKFYEFTQQDPTHSLIDTPLWTGRQLGLDDFDQQPVFRYTDEEYKSTRDVVNHQPTIAIESVYQSAQSWADSNTIKSILDKYLNTHRILWLSNQGAPSHSNVDNLLRFTRRQVIMCLRACDIFFSVGSGFFCASLALKHYMQPNKIACLWKDELYRYERPIATHNWHQNITWIHNQDELTAYLANQ